MLDTITSGEFQDICNNNDTKIIKYGRIDQPKVYEHGGQTIIKLFYAKKKWLSSDRIRPRAMRFCKNTQSLQRYGYEVPQILKVQHCPELRIHLVHYTKIEGVDVRKLATLGNLSVIDDVASLLADLHQNGIFFRSIHLENLLYKSDHSFALIDITDVKFKSGPLSLYMRFRNLKHLLSEPYDKAIWEKYGVDHFLNIYFKKAGMSSIERKLLTRLVHRAIKF